MRQPFVVITGLPASGKSTLAQPLAEALGVECLSKDRIKEALFDGLGYGGWERSKTLSRAADAAMIEVAVDLEGAVLDNFWHPETVVDLLSPLQGPRIEVYCRCDPAVAFERFLRRQRHPGHADAENLSSRAEFSEYAAMLPLGTLGPVIEVTGEARTDPVDTTSRVRAATPSR